MVTKKDQEFVQHLLEWFKDNKRTFAWRDPKLSPFNLLIAEIMLQKTGANQVEPLFTSFIQDYPTVESVARLSEEQLGEILKPLGLFKRRARDIKRTVNLSVKLDTHLTTVKHAYTHFKLHMDVFLCRAAAGRIRLDGPEDFRWIYPENIDEFPFHKAVHKSFPALMSALGLGK